jgi:hypothetical protein
MVRPLRKAHLVIWILLSVFLPVAVVLAFINIPERALNQSSIDDSATPLPVVVGSYEDSAAIITVRKSSDQKEAQLEWELKIPLAGPSNLVFANIRVPDSCCVGTAKVMAVEGPETEQLIGALGSKGKYYFKLGNSLSDTLKISLQDAIHKTTIKTYTIKL